MFLGRAGPARQSRRRSGGPVRPCTTYGVGPMGFVVVRLMPSVSASLGFASFGETEALPPRTTPRQGLCSSSGAISVSSPCLVALAGGLGRVARRELAGREMTLATRLDLIHLGVC
jgi:hypothetical protein